LRYFVPGIFIMKNRHFTLFLALTGVFLLFLSGCEHPSEKSYHLQTESVRLKSLDEIILVAKPRIKPVLYTNVYGLEKLPVRKAKAKFISAVLPSILIAKYEIDQRRMKVESLLKKKEWTSADSIFYDEMKNRYRAKTDDELKIRIGSLPTSLVLAQAAVESGWGKSRFFLEANNLFGVWSYNIHDSRIPARIARKNKRTYLRSYKDMSESIVHYFEILARSRSYKSLREARVKTDDPFELLPHLKYFSERRTLYTTQLRQIIKRNNFTQFDRYEIDPQYIQEDIVED